MNRNHITISAALVLMLAGAVGAAEAKTRHVSCTFANTFVDGIETHIDTNSDNISASLLQGIANCNIGRLFFREEYEFQAPLPAPVTCPAGTQELHLQQDHGAEIEEQTSDQLFYEVATNAATACVNPDLTFSVTSHGTYAGGTGKFAGATGSFDVRATGEFLVLGSKDGVLGDFGQINGTLTGTLTLSKGGADGQGGD